MNGPVIKVYQSSTDDDNSSPDKARISHVTDMPVILDYNDSPIMPSDLLLYDYEGKLVLKNDNDPSQLFIYDLETGRISQQIKTGKETVQFN